MIDFAERFNAHIASVDEKLRALVRSTSYSDEFKAVLEYALFPGGKRLRPLLLLECHSLFAPPDARAVEYACGIELIHSYSLIHDDMPCMDDDDMRRGKPSVHKKYGESKALLAGDALMDLGYATLYKPFSGGGSPFSYFAAECGGGELIRGQYSDLFDDIKTVEELLTMFKGKTGALIELACLGGFALGNGLDYNGCRAIHASRELAHSYQSIREFASCFGTAFQLYDDISEYENGEAAGATSIVRFMPVEEAKVMLADVLDRAMRALDGLRADTSCLKALISRFAIN